MRPSVTISVLAGVATLALASQVHAQTSGPGTSAPANDQPAGAQTGADQSLAGVTVTGSRVITNGNQSPTPLTVVTSQDLLQLAPTNIADALNQLPAMTGSKSQDSRPTGSASPFSGGNASANQLNLRSLGLTTTLVMVDGQRVVPSLFTGTLDIDLLPELLTQRVDVVTGGASAVYGSDALAGVVNYVIDHNLNGIKAEAQYGVSTYGDNKSNKLGIAAGTSLFGNAVHVEASFEHYHDNGLPLESDRPNLLGWGVPGAGTVASPYTLENNLRLDSLTYGGLISNGPLKGNTFNTNGVITPFVNGAATGVSSVQQGGDGVLPVFDLVAPEAYNKFFGRVDFDLSDTVHGHAEAWFADKTSYAIGASAGNTPDVYNFNDTFSTTNAFLSPAVQTLLGAPKTTTFTLAKAFSYDYAPPQTSDTEEQQATFNAGLEGKLGRFKWGVDLNYGRSTLYDYSDNNVNPQNLSASLDAVINPANGQVVCNVTLTNPTADPGCVPLNPFGPTASTSSAINYILYNGFTIGVFHMYDGNAHITGDLFNDWAGPVVGSLSAEWRQIDYRSSVSLLSTTFENCTGLRFNCNTGTSIGGGLPFAPAHLTVTEPAVEFEVPLAKDLFLAKSIDVNAAARAVHYSTVGSYTPYKIGPEWQITDSFRLRATYSRDISAPSLFELFQPVPTMTVAISGSGVSDTLLGSSYPISNYNLGNPNLKAEVGITKTIGLVWQPAGTGLSISSDYYRISINNYILQLQGFQASVQNTCYASGGSSPVCQLITRPSYTSKSPTNLITATYTEFFNIASMETWGDDLEVNYAFRSFDRPFSLRLLASYQPHIILSAPGINDTYDIGDAANGPTPFTAHPSVRLTGLLRVGVTDNITFGIDERWRNSMVLNADVSPLSGVPIVFATNHVASVGYTDINLSYRVGTAPTSFEVFLDVHNLLNTPPPPATLVINQLGPGLGMVAGDDPVGRYFTLGMRASL